METPNESEEGRMSEVKKRVKNFPGSGQGRFRRDVSGRGKPGTIRTAQGQQG